MTIIVKDDQGNVVVEQEMEAQECKVDIVEDSRGQIQCSIEQMIASIH